MFIIIAFCLINSDEFLVLKEVSNLKSDVYFGLLHLLLTFLRFSSLSFVGIVEDQTMKKMILGS